MQSIDFPVRTGLAISFDYKLLIEAPTPVLTARVVVVVVVDVFFFVRMQHLPAKFCLLAQSNTE